MSWNPIDWGEDAINAVGGAIGDAANWVNDLGKNHAADAINAKPQQYDFATGQLGQIASGAAGRAAPQIGGTQLRVDQAGRQGMLDTAGRLGAIAAGTQQGAGEMALNAQLGRANAAQIAAARASRGANAALAYRNAMRNQADIGLAGAGQAGAARLQDQAAANAQLGSLFGNVYGQDIGVAGQNAQLGQAAQLANQNATLQQTQLNDAARIQAIGQMLGWDQTMINAQIQKAQMNANDKGLLGQAMQFGGQALVGYATGALGGPAAAAAAPAAGQSLSQLYPHGGYGGGNGLITSPSMV